MLEEFEQIIYEVTGKRGITYDTDFVQDLHLTSFDVMSIIGVIEMRYDVELPTRDAWKLATVQDAITYMEKKGVKLDYDSNH